VRDNDVQTVGRSALKNYDQTLGASAGIDGAKGRAGEETWNCCRTDDGERAVVKENATRDGHKQSLRRDVACYVSLADAQDVASYVSTAGYLF
jgi:hypothetical protein